MDEETTGEHVEYEARFRLPTQIYTVINNHIQGYFREWRMADLPARVTGRGPVRGYTQTGGCIPD